MSGATAGAFKSHSRSDTGMVAKVQSGLHAMSFGLATVKPDRIPL